MREEIQIPETWSKCQIEEITLPVAKINQKENPDQQIEYIDISGIDNLRNKIGETKQYCIGEAPSRARQIVQEGDVLFSTVRPYLRNIAAVPEKYNGQIASTGFSVLRPAKGIAPLYLFYNCIYIDFVNALSGEQYGVSYPAVKDEQVRGKRINLPPTNEQKRIVAKIEELFSELDKGIENLKTAWEQLKAYRQAVLKHAFEGKLTAQWREENKDKLKTVDVLLEDIKTEREDHIKKLSKKRVKSPRDFKDEDFSWLPELPDGWTWERLGWVTSGVEYGTSAKSSKEGDIPVLRMGNIQKAKLDWGDLVYTSDKEEIEKYSLNKGDVLFNRTNSPELVGKAAIYRNENPAIFAGYLIRLNHIETIVDSQYLNFFLNSHVAKQYGNRVKTDGVNQSNINGEKLINYPFPYCSLDEQKQIVERLDERITELDRTENDIVEQLQKAEALRQSILRQAFSGKLAAQDPNDEPTSVLLECIKAEKNGIKKKKECGMSEQELYALLGKFASWLLSAAGGAGLLLLFLKIWGQNWIESKFLKDLELFKAQKLHEFDILLKRKIKWHEKEHESLSESWKKLVMAHRSLKGAIFSFRKSPDLERMSREEFNRFLESGDLSNDEKEYLTGNREGLNTAYSRILDIRSLNDAHKAFLEFNLYFDTNKIFLRPHIKEKFQEADDYIWSAWVSQKMSYDLRDSKADFAIKALDTEKDKIAPLIKDIENIVQKELFPEQKQESENSR